MKLPNRAAMSPMGCVPSNTGDISVRPAANSAAMCHPGAGHEPDVEGIHRRAERDDRERRDEQRVHRRSRSARRGLSTRPDIGGQPHPDSGDDECRACEHRQVHRAPMRRVRDQAKLVGGRAGEHRDARSRAPRAGPSRAAARRRVRVRIRSLDSSHGERLELESWRTPPASLYSHHRATRLGPRNSTAFPRPRGLTSDSPQPSTSSSRLSGARLQRGTARR